MRRPTWDPPVLAALVFSAAMWLVILLGGCSADFVAPEDERCTVYVGDGQPASISRWQLDNCEAVTVVVVRVG